MTICPHLSGHRWRSSCSYALRLSRTVSWCTNSCSRLVTRALWSDGGTVSSVGSRKPPETSEAAESRPDQQQDPRLVATLITGRVDGPLDIKPGDWIVAMSPVRLPDGRILAYHPPQPVAFNLIEAKR